MKTDFVILTALPEEREAICQVFGIEDRISSDTEDSTIYWRKKFSLGNDEFYEIVVAESGPSNAA